jgi:hypothetical protein
MSICTIHTPFRVGDRISGRTARRSVAHPREAAVNGLTGAADGSGSAPAASSQIRRRWSIAALIAAATWSQDIAQGTEAGRLEVGPGGSAGW